MKYSQVRMQVDKWSGDYIEDNRFSKGCNNIIIDGKGWAYDIMDNGKTLLHNTPWCTPDGTNRQVFTLNCVLPLDRLHPKDTIDRFFALLAIQ